MRKKVTLITGNSPNFEWRRRPTSDVQHSGNWTETGNGDGLAWNELNDYSDQTTFWTLGASVTDKMELKCNNRVTAPPDDTTVDINLIMRGGTGTTVITVEIKEGTTVRESSDRTLSSGGTYGNYSKNIDLSAVTDWSDMRISINWKSGTIETFEIASLEFKPGA